MTPSQARRPWPSQTSQILEVLAVAVSAQSWSSPQAERELQRLARNLEDLLRLAGQALARALELVELGRSLDFPAAVAAPTPRPRSSTNSAATLQ